MNLLLLLPPSPSLPFPKPPLPILAIGGKRRKSRKTPIRSADLAALRTALSFAASIPKCLSQVDRPPDLLLLLQGTTGDGGGGGGGGLGFRFGGPGGGGGWFRRRRGAKGLTLAGIAGFVVSLAVASAIGWTPETELGIRGLVPAVLGMRSKARVWRGWTWMGFLVFAIAFYSLTMVGVGRRREVAGWKWVAGRRRRHFVV